MGTLLSYSLYSSILLSMLYLTYKWVMAGENQHRYNRVALWLIYIVALTALPAAEWARGFMADAPAPVPMAEIDFEDIMVSVADQSELVAPSQPLWITVLLWVYLAGVAATLFQTVWVGLRLRRIISRGEEAGRYGGKIVVVTDDEGIAPFSWCRYVVMSRKDWEEDGSMILVHELQHLRLRHWIDLLIAQAVGVFQWYNPAAWLMREELKAVHEYQADGAVLESGVGARQYQMLLIKKAVGHRFTSLANSLNHSKLKKRITMMYNTDTAPSRRLRGLALLPALAVAVGVANLDVVASVIDDTALASFVADNGDDATVAESAGVQPVDEVMLPPSEKSADATDVEPVTVAGGDVAASVSSDGTSREPAAKPVEESAGGRVVTEVPPHEVSETVEAIAAHGNGMSAPASSAEGEVAERRESSRQADGSRPFTVVESKPQFPGGEKALLQYIASHIRYPQDAYKSGIEGRVVVSFVVKKDGSIGDVKSIRKINPSLDAEAERVIKSLPAFTPGTLNGDAVDVWYTLPVSFKIKKDEIKKDDSIKKDENPTAMTRSLEKVTLYQGNESRTVSYERIKNINPNLIDSINVIKNGGRPEVNVYLKSV